MRNTSVQPRFRGWAPSDQPLKLNLVANWNAIFSDGRNRQFDPSRFVDCSWTYRYNSEPSTLIKSKRIKVVVARTLPALVAGEQEGLATYQIRRANDLIFTELITFDALTPGRGVGTALVEGLVSKLRAEGVKILRVTTTIILRTLVKPTKYPWEEAL